ncbi:F-box only protein 43-like [Dreissena polymorpha]|uniref:ZBR-type domain-containing protein n=1 Tax=Dreissena polymorpha TaxID=45954 RepID=A0A9D4BMM7_DREPO|nr:F-box only protein 43-like [Dreissena polymorpha]KAH3709486.1 hypothetical protein DPMN_068949 [Dreissena polymorpha]
MDEFLQGPIQRLPPPADLAKSRTFSTSTPFIGNLNVLKGRGLFSTTDDSGLGNSPSLTELSICTPFQSGQPTVSVSICVTPTKDLSFAPFHASNTSVHSSGLGYSSTRSVFTRRSLDSACSVSSETRVFSTRSDSLNSSHKELSRSLVRRLDLDIDIYDYSNKGAESANILKNPVLPKRSETVLASCFEDALKKFSPEQSDRLIGRKIGLASVDIIFELSQRNIACLSTILTFLHPQDLCSMCSVSRSWKDVVLKDCRANTRRRKLIKQHRVRLQEMGKENVGKRPAMRSMSRDGTAPLQRLPGNQLTTGEPPTPGGIRGEKTLAQQFIEVGSQLTNEEKLQKCPQCRKPAKCLPIQERGICQNPDCLYDFCTKCSYKFHGSKECVPIITKNSEKTSTIGTKKSKNNLKRL